MLSLKCVLLKVLRFVCVSVGGSSPSQQQHQQQQHHQQAVGVSPQSDVPATSSTTGTRPSKGRPTKGGPRQIASCALCNKTFNNSSALAKHKLTHSDERKYVCAICSKAFKRQDHL